jgi:nitroreductase
MLDRAEADRLLTTTRTVRRRLDLTRPVPASVLAECIEIATQAPTGGNLQKWAFVVVRDPEKRRALGAYYRRGNARLDSEAYAPPVEASDTAARSYRSARWLVEHISDVPALVIVCGHDMIDGVPPAFAAATTFGSVLPAAWSYMLAARARGLGTAWTTYHLFHEDEVAELLGIPDGWHQAVLIPTAYYTGDEFQPGPRRPVTKVTHWDVWGDRQVPAE